MYIPLLCLQKTIFELVFYDKMNQKPIHLTQMLETQNFTKDKPHLHQKLYILKCKNLCRIFLDKINLFRYHFMQRNVEKSD